VSRLRSRSTGDCQYIIVCHRNCPILLRLSWAFLLTFDLRFQRSDKVTLQLILRTPIVSFAVDQSGREGIHFVRNLWMVYCWFTILLVVFVMYCYQRVKRLRGSRASNDWASVFAMVECSTAAKLAQEHTQANGDRRDADLTTSRSKRRCQC
jgi:hypothetical protein